MADPIATLVSRISFSVVPLLRFCLAQPSTSSLLQPVCLSLRRVPVRDLGARTAPSAPMKITQHLGSLHNLETVSIPRPRFTQQSARFASATCRSKFDRYPPTADRDSRASSSSTRGGRLDASRRRPTVRGTQVFLETSPFRAESVEKPPPRVLPRPILERRRRTRQARTVYRITRRIIGRFKSSGDLFLRRLP